MSTDNRELLFPDVTEHYGPELTPTDDTRASAELAFAIPAETFPDSDTVAAASTHEPAADAQDRTEDTAPADGDSVIQTDLEPIDPAPAGTPDGRVDNSEDTATQEDHSNYDTSEDAAESSLDDPYAAAPDWVRAHIPRGPLVVQERPRGGFKSVVGRGRKPRPAAPTSPPPVQEPATVGPAGSTPAGGAAGEKPSRTQGKGLMLVGAAVAVVSVAAAAAVTVMTGNNADTPMPAAPAPTTTATTSATPTAAAPLWCAAVNEPRRVVGNGGGGRDSGPAVIQAFEHAYYGQRNGDAVAALMLMPSPVADIQSFIDAVPAGTEHCVTVLPTEDPNRWSVDVLLKFPPLGNEGIHQQWITTTSGDGGMKIATIEDRK